MCVNYIDLIFICDIFRTYSQKPPKIPEEKRPGKASAALIKGYIGYMARMEKWLEKKSPKAHKIYMLFKTGTKRNSYLKVRAKLKSRFVDLTSCHCIQILHSLLIWHSEPLSFGIFRYLTDWTCTLTFCTFTTSELYFHIIRGCTVTYFRFIWST